MHQSRQPLRGDELTGAVLWNDSKQITLLDLANKCTDCSVILLGIAKCLYVTGPGKTKHICTFSVTRKTDLKY